MSAPTTIFPETYFSTQKAPPKQSLVDIGQAGNASAPILNAIEAIHWISFPAGFWVVHYIFVHADKIAPYVGGDPTRVFFLMLGLLSQVFGGGISGNMMHLYEGWQVAPFRNPLALPEAPVPPGDVEQLRVPSYNNAWLRSVAYQMLFTFQTLGLGLFTVAAFGTSGWPPLLLAGSVAVALLGPHKGRPDFKVNGEPVLPLSWSLLLVFAVNVVANLVGYRVLFGDALAALPALGFIPQALAPWVPLLAPLAVAAGGAVEGAVAESTFNQWWHFIAFVILLAGLGLHGVLYWLLVSA
ncbi:hypothetical protein HYH03_010312 [Edaphochlamys debaryana]|uniref:Uncharacterized protein n=1 Tax=Edaphochlamys debaryana TaxID=47281 RepID=A0A836BW33_9CHLO|nr:hypothetical protein HYH03_010312 [Edaphochlamys debaryana]|eukprot:KAG2491306.1 hypothetical protein HYH03_010312 [Edaphochlamys debaryana]